MENSPAPQNLPASGLPERRLSSTDVEAVIRRAVELQATSAPEGEGVTEGEMVRIGRELGIPAPYLQQALVEVRGRGTTESGVLTTAFGSARIAASRVVSIPAERVRDDLERYMLDREHMLVQRRRPGWTVYERGSSIGAQLGRGLSRLKLINAPLVEVSVEPAGEGTSYVSLAADLSTTRAGFAAGAALGGGGAGLASAAAFAIAIAPPAAFLGLPITAAMWWGMRAGYDSVGDRTHLRLESVLDRLESGELLPRPSSGRQPWDIFKLRER